MRYVDTVTDNSPRLSEWLTSQLADADLVAMRTGFTSIRGVNLVIDHLTAVLGRGGRVEIVAGGTEDQPDTVRIVTDPDVFQNAKTYYVRATDGSTTAWVGSANLTYGGLATNHEAVVILDAEDPETVKDQVLHGIQAYAEGNGAEPLTVDTIRRLEVQKSVARGGWRSNLPPLGLTWALEDLFRDTIDEIDATATRAGSQQTLGIPTGVEDLDAITNGLHPGQLVVIAGRPSAGASTLLTDFARNCSIKENLPSVTFSMQHRHEELMQRILCAEAKIRLGDMRTGRMTDDDWTRLARRMREIAESPLLLNCSPAAHIDVLYNTVVDLAASKDIRAVFIDSLNSIRATVESGASREREIAAVARQLKVLALHVQVPIVVTAELGKTADQRFDRRPYLGDFRESDAITQVADNVILLHRPDLWDRDDPRAGEADLILAKHRAGPPATITVAHQLHYSRFANFAKG
jgi:KaiC/GvpD/RAD55 family RecA-like ATPase